MTGIAVIAAHQLVQLRCLHLHFFRRAICEASTLPGGRHPSRLHAKKKTQGKCADMQTAESRPGADPTRYTAAAEARGCSAETEKDCLVPFSVCLLYSSMPQQHLHIAGGTCCGRRRSSRGRHAGYRQHAPTASEAQHQLPNPLGTSPHHVTSSPQPIYLRSEPNAPKEHRRRCLCPPGQRVFFNLV